MGCMPPLLCLLGKRLEEKPKQKCRFVLCRAGSGRAEPARVIDSSVVCCGFDVRCSVNKKLLARGVTDIKAVSRSVGGKLWLVLVKSEKLAEL